MRRASIWWNDQSKAVSIPARPDCRNYRFPHSSPISNGCKSSPQRIFFCSGSGVRLHKPSPISVFAASCHGAFLVPTSNQPNACYQADKASRSGQPFFIHAKRTRRLKCGWSDAHLRKLLQAGFKQDAVALIGLRVTCRMSAACLVLPDPQE